MPPAGIRRLEAIAVGAYAAPLAALGGEHSAQRPQVCVPMERTSAGPIHSVARLVAPLALLAVLACQSTLTSAQLGQGISLPVPANTGRAPDPERLNPADQGESYRLTPRTVIALAFDRQPDIKSSFERFKSEEARYDFFYTSNDALTPRFNVTNEFGEVRADEGVTRDRRHVFEVGVEKLFFDTTELDVGLGFQSGATDQAIGDHPFVAASMRYPLWVSRRKLARTSEDIFRRNELNDAQLDYIQEARRRLERALFKFYDVVGLRTEVAFLERQVADFEDLMQQIGRLEGRDLSVDLPRVEAELARAQAEYRNRQGWYQIQRARLKSNCGLPFHARVELSDEPFNPFAGAGHEELMQASIETDPEIATLKNAQRNAEVQLDLARRGRWDVSLVFDGTSSLEGRGEDESTSDWALSAGVEISAVDSRVTESLTRQARANILRFSQAIAARENDIFVDTLEPIIRIDTLGTSRDELIRNLPRYQEDYTKGLDDYLRGQLNIDDLITRRRTLLEQEDEIMRLTQRVGFNVAELCAATGRFFDLLDPRQATPPLIGEP